MADHFFGLSRTGPDTFPQVTVGTSTGSTEVEVRISDTSPAIQRKDAVLLLKAIIEWINTNQSGGSTDFLI